MINFRLEPDLRRQTKLWPRDDLERHLHRPEHPVRAHQRRVLAQKARLEVIRRSLYWEKNAEGCGKVDLALLPIQNNKRLPKPSVKPGLNLSFSR